MRIQEYTLAELREAQIEQSGRLAERKAGVDEAVENLHAMQRRFEHLRQADSVEFQRIQEITPDVNLEDLPFLVEDLALVIARRTAREMLVGRAKAEIEIRQQSLTEASRRHEREVALLENIVAELHAREREIARFNEALELQQLRDQARLNVAARAISAELVN